MSFFHTDPFPTDDSQPDLSILHELEMEYANDGHIRQLQTEFFTEEDVYSSPLSDTSIPFTISSSPYDPLPTMIKSESHTSTCTTPSPHIPSHHITSHHIPILPFQSVTATRTAKKRRRFAGMEALRSSDDEQQDDASIGSSDSHTSSSSPTPSTGTDDGKKKRRKSTSTPAVGKRERNKVSASKYRKRRKMYLDTLEDRTNELEQKYVHVTEQVTALDSENRVLKEQLAFLKSLLHGKGTDMNHLEQQLQDGLSNTTTQQGSIFMFVLFSCFLLFNPMTWFTSTPATTSITSVDTVYTSRPSSIGHVGRNLLQHDDFNYDMSDDGMESAHKMMEFMSETLTATMMDSMDSIPDYSSAPALSVASVSSASHQSAPASAPASSASYASAPARAAPASASSAPASAPQQRASRPLTGAPDDLAPASRDIDIDDAVRTYQVAQPVDANVTMENENSTKSVVEKKDSIMDTVIPATAASPVDMSTMHKTVHDHAFMPLVRLMGETRAREALQSLAQGVLDVHLHNQTELTMTRHEQQAPEVY